MAESRKQTIVMMCSVIGCIVTLITCGVLIGNVQADVATLKEDTKMIHTNKDAISEMKTKQAFLEGVVSTQLDNIQQTQTQQTAAITEIHKRVDDLVRVE